MESHLETYHQLRRDIVADLEGKLRFHYLICKQEPYDNEEFFGNSWETNMIYSKEIHIRIFSMNFNELIIDKNGFAFKEKKMTFKPWIANIESLLKLYEEFKFNNNHMVRRYNLLYRSVFFDLKRLLQIYNVIEMKPLKIASLQNENWAERAFLAPNGTVKILMKTFTEKGSVLHLEPNSDKIWHYLDLYFLIKILSEVEGSTKQI